MKYFSYILLFIVLLTCAGCSRQEQLPTNITEVGGSIIKERDSLLQTQDMRLPTNTQAVDADLSALTSEMVSGWYSELLLEQFTEQPAEEGFTIASASLADGGTIEIMDYYGSYYSTTFSYPATAEQEAIVEAAASNIEVYLARRLTDAEGEKLRQAIGAAMLGSELVQIQALADYVRVSVFLESERVYIQCS